MYANPVTQVARIPGIRCLGSSDRCLIAKESKALSGFRMYSNKMGSIFPDFKWLGFRIQIFEIQTSATQPFFDHLESRLVRISDPHCKENCSCFRSSMGSRSYRSQGTLHPRNRLDSCNLSDCCCSYPQEN